MAHSLKLTNMRAETSAHLTDIYSLSSCVNDDFADYTDFWKHNEYWLFNSPEIIQTLAHEHNIDLTGTTLFYYEIFGLEFDKNRWKPYTLLDALKIDVIPPKKKQLEGYDVVTFYARSSPECSPLSCNALAEKIPTNSHCLLENLQEAKGHLEDGAFLGGEPGPHRIFAVYTVEWSQPIR